MEAEQILSPTDSQQPIVYESFCNDLHANSSLTSPAVCNGKPQPETQSIFGDTDCGEPLKAQHLIIDFTPDSSLDTEESQRKCSEFWEYIHSRDDLVDFVALPDPDLNIKDEFKYEAPSSTILEGDYNQQKETTAVSMLEICEEKDLIKRAFEPKMDTSYCTINAVTYEDKPSTSKSLPKNLNVCKCPGPCRKCPSKSKSKLRSTPEIVELCNTLKNWDERHSKSMDPPGPLMQHIPILQRRRSPPI